MPSSIRSKESNFFGVHQMLREEVPKAVGTIRAEDAARFSGATPKAANYWAGGHCLPSLAHALALARHEPHLKALILKILEVEEAVR